MKINKKHTLRHLFQFGFFIFVFGVTASKFLSEQGINIPFLKGVSLHAICPFGGVETLYSFITTGTLLRKIHMSAMVLFFAVSIISILFGNVFCGWICPFGFFQEMIGKLGRKIFGEKYNGFAKTKAHSILKYSRYLVLILVIYNTISTSKLIFQQYDPYYALFNFFTNEVAVTAYVILIVTMLLSLIVERPFCRYACPFGAILGITNKISIFKIKRNEKTCLNCNLCSKSCPMNIDVACKKVINDTQCISCLQCTTGSACPQNNTVEIMCGGFKNEIE